MLLNDKNNRSENLEKEAPFLSKMMKENHFSAPKNYFKVLPEVINDKKLNNNLLRNYFDKLSWRVLVPSLAISALFLIVFNFNDNNNDLELTPDQISDIIINDDYIEIEDYIVYEVYAETIEFEKESNLETDEYINYLIENDIDINSIIEEL